MLNFLIILAIFVAVIIGYKTGFNTGFFAIVFAYLIGGFVMGMTPKDIIADGLSVQCLLSFPCLCSTTLLYPMGHWKKRLVICSMHFANFRGFFHLPSM